MAGDCNADVTANELMTSLMAGEVFTIPDVDLSDPEFTIPEGDVGVVPTALTNADLTTQAVGGTGTFDVVMSGLKAHLEQEFEKGRITGDQYSKVYLGALEAALGNSVQFLLGRDQAYWTAVRAKFEAQIAQANVVTARVALETAKANLQAVRLQAATQKANYALTKLKLATESINYCIATFNLEEILPTQKLLMQEQHETARAQTLDTRSDGVTTVVGVLGKQKDLYTQQIESYKRDSEQKMTKIFTDAWITSKTIDEGLLPPTQFANSEIDEILVKLRLSHNLS